MTTLRPYESEEHFQEMHRPTARLIGSSFAPALILAPKDRPAWMNSGYSVSLAMMGEYELPPVDENITKRGKLLEATTVSMLRQDGYPDAEGLFHFFVHPRNDRFIASPDYRLEPDLFGEGKAPANFDAWANGEPPPLYPQLQSQWTMGCGETEAHLVTGLLVDRMSIALHKTLIRRHDGIIRMMEDRAEAFLERVERGVAWDPDESDSSYRALQGMLDIAETEVIEVDDPEALDRLFKWRQASKDKKAAVASYEACRNWFAWHGKSAGVIKICGVDQISRKKVTPKGSENGHFKWNIGVSE
jgi:hypothetical protein